MAAGAGMGRDDDASVARIYAQVTGRPCPAGRAEAGDRERSALILFTTSS